MAGESWYNRQRRESAALTCPGRGLRARGRKRGKEGSVRDGWSEWAGGRTPFLIFFLLRAPGKPSPMSPSCSSSALSSACAPGRKKEKDDVSDEKRPVAAGDAKSPPPEKPPNEVRRPELGAADAVDTDAGSDGGGEVDAGAAGLGASD